MQNSFSIGAVAKRSGVKVATIRYYEEIGLLPAPPRTGSNRRTYSEADVSRLKFARRARELGFNLNAVRQLLALAGLPEQPCSDADEIARCRLREVDCKIRSLAALKKELQAMIDQGTHGLIRECRVIEVLANEAPAPRVRLNNRTNSDSS